MTAPIDTDLYVLSLTPQGGDIKNYSTFNVPEADEILEFTVAQAQSEDVLVFAWRTANGHYPKDEATVYRILPNGFARDVRLSGLTAFPGEDETPGSWNPYSRYAGRQTWMIPRKRL